MTAPAISTDFLEQAVRDIFVALMLGGWDEADVKIMAEMEAQSAVDIFRRDYASREVPQ